MALEDCLNVTGLFDINTTTRRLAEWQHGSTANETNSSQQANWTSADFVRMLCFWIVFVVGVVGNLIVVMLVIWKRSHKQVSRFQADVSCHVFIKLHRLFAHLFAAVARSYRLQN
jgi:hypothetical protein